MNQLSKFVKYLGSVKTTDKIFNQYSYNDNLHLSLVTTINLLCYLTTMFELQPKTILIGEAPGYKGCKLTGVPFTSEDIIGSGDIDLFNYDDESQRLLSTSETKLQKENTATIVWKTFKSLDYYPLLWNTLPFYPHDKLNNKNNRTPTSEEIETFGHKPFDKLIAMFPIKNFVAVGRSAEKTLKGFGLKNIHSIPHPSYGNAIKFATELNNLLEKGLSE